MCDNHSHCHDHGEQSSLAETIALLTYMSDHNRHHEQDLREVHQTLVRTGEADAAEALLRAVTLYDDANALLDLALKSLKHK